MDIDKSEISVGKVSIIGATIIAMMIWIYNTVIIPTNNNQVALAQIQLTLIDIKTNIANYNATQLAQDTRISILESEVKALTLKVGDK